MTVSFTTLDQTLVWEYQAKRCGVSFWDSVYMHVLCIPVVNARAAFAEFSSQCRGTGLEVTLVSCIIR